MQNDQTERRRGRTGKIAVGAGLIAAGALAGGVLAGTLSASADTTTSPSTSASSGTNQEDRQSSAQSGQRGAPPANGQHPGHGGSSPVRSDEKALSTADAATIKAAALKAVPGGAVYRVETDAGDAAYEAHMTKADGTLVTVKLDKSFVVTGVEDGMGKGDPAPSGAQSGHQGQPPTGQQGSSSRTPSA